MVLERSEYPASFPQDFQIVYVSESRELVIEYELPDVSVVPEELEHRYVKSRDQIDTKTRKATEIKALYQDVVAAICLRTIHEVLEADHSRFVETVVFSGFVQNYRRCDGQEHQPALDISKDDTRKIW